jgi:hypothetical protein
VQGAADAACGAEGVTCTNCAAVSLSCQSGACQGAAPACGPATCAGGCCDAQGACRLGTELDACGTGGEACAACGAGLGCAGGVCEGTAPACGPATCGGCCDPAGNCQPGTSTAACGVAGEACAACGGATNTCALPAGYCAFFPPCGPATCPGGCCDAAGVCQAGTTDAACGTSSSSCVDCTTQGEACAPSGFCYSGKHCGPDNCGGCCTTLGECVGGSDNGACGQYGGLCANCASSNQTCAGFACTSASTCPAPYAGCNPMETAPVPKKAPACDASVLQNLATACAGDGTKPACNMAFTSLFSQDAACYGCMSQFFGGQGYASCLAPFLSPECNHMTACSLDCENAACGGCADPTSTSSCYTQVFQKGGACLSFTNSYYCTQAAIAGPAKFCDLQQFGGDSGQWIKSVGTYYCASGK